MPSSAPNQINQIVQLMMMLKPQSVLDIGIGFGKFGFLAREYLELWDGRNKYDDWQRRIDGIEANEAYVTDLQKLIYSNIYIGNALEVLPKIDHIYDLLMMVDIFEHFTPEEGQKLFSECRRKSKAILISTPKVVKAQDDVFDNEYEQHRSQWHEQNFIAPVKYRLPHPTKLIIFMPQQRIPELDRAITQTETVPQ